MGLCVVLLLLTALLWRPVSRAWHETLLREATLPQLEAMAEQDPFDGRALALLATRLAEAKDFVPAAETFERAAGLGENDPLIWLTWAAATAAGGDRMKASAVLRFGMQDVANAPKLKIALERANGLGPTASPQQLAEAISPEGMKPLLDRYTQGSYLNGIALWLGTRNKAKSGFATRERMAKDHPQDKEWLRLWGEALTENHRLPEAEKALQEVLAASPKSPEAHLAVGNLLFKGGQTAKAGVEYTQALHLKPNWPDALLGLGNVAVEKNLIPIGVDVFERLIKQTPQSPDAWIGLGRAYYNQRLHLDKSLEAFQKAEQLAPNRTDFYNDYSNALRNNFKLDEAEAITHRRLAVAPEDARAYYLLALLLIDNRQSPSRESDAEKALRTSQKLAPTVVATSERFGRLLLERNQPYAAVHTLQSALTLDKYNVPATLSLERAYRKLGRLQAADRIRAAGAELSLSKQKTAYLEDQINRDPLNQETHNKLVKLYMSGGENKKAKLHADMAYLLKERPDLASKGIKALRDQSLIIVPPDKP